MQVISTVLTPASTTGLVTWADVKLELNLPDAEQAWTEGAIARASAVIAGYCDRTFGVQEVRDDFLPDAFNSPKWPLMGQPLILSSWPAVAVSTVTVKGVALDPASDCRIEPDSGMIYRLDSGGNVRQWSFEPTSITYTAGYLLPGDEGYVMGALDALPGDITDVAMSLVTSRYFSRGRDPMVKSESVPDVGDTGYWVGSIGSGPMPENLSSILDAYVRVVI